MRLSADVIEADAEARHPFLCSGGLRPSRFFVQKGALPNEQEEGQRYSRELQFGINATVRDRRYKRHSLANPSVPDSEKWIQATRS